MTPVFVLSRRNKTKALKYQKAIQGGNKGEERNREEGVGAGSRTRTGTAIRPRDFKSLVSTNFTIPAGHAELYTTNAGLGMEARVGIEPAYTELQSAA